MRKFLLSFAAASMCVASCFADEAVYGTTPETAKPFPAGGWFVPDLDTAPKEAWFTYTSHATVPAQWGDIPGDMQNPAATHGQQVFVYLCKDGQQAFQMSSGDSYILFPEQEYLVKITPEIAGFYCMQPPVPLPDRYEGTAKYYPFLTTSEDWSTKKTVERGKTAWYQLNVPYPTQVALKQAAMAWMNLTEGVTKIEAYHIDCPGGKNEGDLIVGPYVKEGRNIIGVTAEENLDAPVAFCFSYNSMATLNSKNHLLRGQSLVVDTKASYPDAYYTVDRFFKVPEDGTYTFTNHGAKGTKLNIGMVKLTDPTDEYKYECDWSNLKSAAVGDNDAVITVTDLKKDDIVVVQSDAFDVLGGGFENAPYLMVTKGSSSISEIAADVNSLKVNAANGKLSVESSLLASGAEVVVYNMLANKVAVAKVAKGSASAEMALDVTPGVYIVVVYGNGSSESAKIVVK